MLQALRKTQGSDSTSNTTSPETLADYGLGGVECELCNNTGQRIERGPGLLELHVLECPCMKKRRFLRSLRKAGLEDMARRYTLDSFVADTEHRCRVKEAAERFVQADSGWFFIAGQSGSGKTHICTAICSRLVEQGKDLYFMPWRDESAELKSIITDSDRYKDRMKKLKTVPALYIDDFLKGRVTEADVNLAFEILNARYNETRLRTILSSERSINEILGIDEAIGGRIFERAKGFVILAPAENWRLKRSGHPDKT